MNPPEGRSSWKMLLVDRDGLLIENHPYLADPSEVIVIQGVFEALSDARKAGLRIAVITNQSGIGRGLVSWNEVHAVNQQIDDLLGPFDSWCICPHLPDGNCECRKPLPGMIVKAAAMLGIPISSCLMAGDRFSDIQAAQRAGVDNALIPSNDTPDLEIALAPRVFPSLGNLVKWMTSGSVGNLCE